MDGSASLTKILRAASGCKRTVLLLDALMFGVHERTFLDASLVIARVDIGNSSDGTSTKYSIGGRHGDRANHSCYDRLIEVQERNCFDS